MQNKPLQPMEMLLYPLQPPLISSCNHSSILPLTNSNHLQIMMAATTKIPKEGMADEVVVVKGAVVAETKTTNNDSLLGAPLHHGFRLNNDELVHRVLTRQLHVPVHHLQSKINKPTFYICVLKKHIHPILIKHIATNQLLLHMHCILCHSTLQTQTGTYIL